MHWQDEGYILSKSNFNENSIIIETFTLNHGKCAGIVYGGTSRKHKKNYQIGNKVFLNWKSKGENRVGYFNTELIKPILPKFFDDKRKTICVLAATSILRILLPDKQINKKIYLSFEKLTDDFDHDNWIEMYIFWELSLVKELGYEISLSEKLIDNNIGNNIKINDKKFIVPKLLLKNEKINSTKKDIIDALLFNKNLIMENFLIPNRLKLPFSRNILEKYYY